MYLYFMIRNLLGEDLGPLNSKELESLERQLDMSLKQIRSTRVYTIHPLSLVTQISVISIHIDACSNVCFNFCVYAVHFINKTLLDSLKRQHFKNFHYYC